MIKAIVRVYPAGPPSQLALFLRETLKVAWIVRVYLPRYEIRLVESRCLCQTTLKVEAILRV